MQLIGEWLPCEESPSADSPAGPTHPRSPRSLHPNTPHRLLLLLRHPPPRSPLPSRSRRHQIPFRRWILDRRPLSPLRQRSRPPRDEVRLDFGRCGRL